MKPFIVADTILPWASDIVLVKTFIIEGPYISAGSVFIDAW